MRLYGKYIDLVVQSLCIVIASFIGVAVIIASNPHDRDWPLGILFIQLILGPWQLIGSLVSVFRKAKSRKLKSIHLFASLLYLAVLIPLIQADFANKHTRLLLLTVPAWTLAIGYYSITWRGILKRSERGKGFLPHLGF
ncbi:hypothetical protein [Parachryseolinea silvisoli]|uniref:hypothetical protein n=1 Tax=Parachryseolinea silvisoli TaxID=2873601 RepID=UPI002265CD23|nr:hypothetical protein [Parachryseolinea silvisoli]MCD9016219.1 hypothetical protein [Parachryseolinea silvisoli]